MGKNEGQRKPKSQKGAITSSQAASIVSSSSSSSGGGNLGFGSSLMEAFNRKAGVGSSSVGSASSDSTLDSTVQSYLKHLNKRDPTTRSKALQSLTQYISEKEEEEQISICKQILPHMEEVFKRIAVLDLDRKVRLNLFVFWKLVVQKVGKQLGHYIKKLMPYWLMEMVGIDDKDVSKAAVNAFHQAFAPDKRDAAILYCDAEIMNVLFENFNQTVESLSLSETEQQSITKEEGEERYSRFITSSILMLNKMIDLSMQPKKDESGQQTLTLNESYSKIFRSKNFWKFLGIKSYNNIREAMSRLSITLLKNDLLSKDDTEVMENIVPFIAPIFIGCFNQQPLERTTLDSLILFLQKFAPECWTHVNIWKQTFPRFFSFLRDPPNPAMNYSIVLPFVSMLNTEVYGAEKSVKFVSDLFENIWVGFEKVSSSTKQTNKADKDAIIDTLCDCIIYITLQPDKYAKEDQKDEVLNLTRNALVKTCTHYLTNSCTVNFGKYLTTAIGKLQSKAELADYMSQFWTRTTEYCLANLDKIDLVSIEIFISRCSKADNTDPILNLANTLFQKSMKTGQIGVACAIAFSNHSVLSNTLFEENLETLWQTNQQNEHVQQLLGLYFTQFPEQFSKLEKNLEQDVMSSSISLFPFLRSLYSEDSNFNQTSLVLEKSLLARKDLDSIEHLIGHKRFTSKRELRALLTSIIDQHQDIEERAVEFIMATPGEFSVDINVLLSLFKTSHYDVLSQLLSPKQEHIDEIGDEFEEDEEHKEEEFKSVVTEEMKNELFDKISAYLKETLTMNPTLTNDILLEQFLKLIEISGTKNYGDAILLNHNKDEVWSFIRGKCSSNLKPIVIGNEVIWNNTKDTNLNELEKSVFMYSRLICVALDYVDTVHKNDVNTRENKWEWLLQQVLHSYYFEFLFNDYTKNLINDFLSNIRKKDGLNIEFCNYLAQRHELELLKIYVSMNSSSVSQLDCNKLLFDSLENVNQVIEDKNKSSTFYEITDSLFDNDTDLTNLNIDLEKVTEWLLGCISISSTLDQLKDQSEYDHLNLFKVQTALSIMYCRLKRSSDSVDQTDEEITMDSIIDFAKEFYEMIKQQNPTQISIIVSNLLINAYTTTNNTSSIGDHSFVEEFILSNLKQITLNLENNFELLDKIVHLAASVARKKKTIKIVRQLIDTFLALNSQSKTLSMQYPIVMERLITRTSKYLKPLQLAQNYSEIKLDSSAISEIIDIIEFSHVTNAKIVSVDLLLLTDYHTDVDRIIDFMERMKHHISEHFNSILKESAVRNKHLTQFAHLYSEYSNDNNNELPYLLSWYYILSLTENSILSQQGDSDLFNKLKENQMYAPVLSLLTCFLYSGEDVMFSLEFREFCDDLMYKFSKVLPLFVRTWFNDCNDTIAIDWIQKRFLEVYSPAIVREEIAKIKKSDALSKTLGAKISMGNQIIAKYEQDEVVLKLTIKIPDLYPLKALQIESDEHSAVNESKYRKWILKMTTMLFSQVTSNGVSDVLMLWKDNLEKYFSGVEPCPICYSVVSGRDHQLPKIECKVCHNKFHGACLYRWFSTSGNQSCPMCRSVGQFK